MEEVTHFGPDALCHLLFKSWLF